MPLNHYDHFVVNAAQPAKRHVIEFKLSEEALEDILKGNESLQLDMNQAKLLVGATQYDFTHLPGSNNVELYRLSNGSKQLDLVGDMMAKCTVQRTHASKGKKKATKHEPTRTTQILDPKDLKKGTKSTSAQIPARRALSPSPSAAATAGTVVPLKTRVVQLLALYPRGTDERELTKPLRVSVEDLQSILPMVANFVGGKYVLKAETYREVKIFDWKNYSAKQREVVIKNASAAFDKLGLGPDAPERDKLLADKVKRNSPPLVAEGYYGAAAAVHMETNNSKWRAGGGGSESEGIENGRHHHHHHGSLLKPPSTQKKVSAKKSPAASSLSGKKKGNSKSSAKAARQSVEKAAATILDMVPNHSARAAATAAAASATLPGSGNLKPTSSSTMGSTPGLGVGSPTLAGRRPSINLNGNGLLGRRGSEAKKASGGSKDTSGVGSGYKIPKVGAGSTIPRKPQSPTIIIPTISTQAEYEDFSRRFMAKYQELKALKSRIDEKKILLDQLEMDLEHAAGTEREGELKRKLKEAFGEETYDRKLLRRNGEPRSGVSPEKVEKALVEKNKHASVTVLAERYRNLYGEVELMQRALHEARGAQAERMSQHAAAAAAAAAGVEGLVTVNGQVEGGGNG